MTDTYCKVYCNVCGAYSIIDETIGVSLDHIIERVSSSPNQYRCSCCGADSSKDSGIQNEFTEVNYPDYTR
jgi:hypothetical protein